MSELLTDEGALFFLSDDFEVDECFFDESFLEDEDEDEARQGEEADCGVFFLTEKSIFTLTVFVPKSFALIPTQGEGGNH